MCDKVTIYRSKGKAQKYSAVLYFGLIPEYQRRAINKNIRDLVENHQIESLLNLSAPEEENVCGEQPFCVDWVFFLIPVAIAVTPFCLLFASSAILYRYCFANQRDQEPEVLETYHWVDDLLSDYSSQPIGYTMRQALPLFLARSVAIFPVLRTLQYRVRKDATD